MSKLKKFSFSSSKKEQEEVKAVEPTPVLITEPTPVIITEPTPVIITEPTVESTVKQSRFMKLIGG